MLELGGFGVLRLHLVVIVIVYLHARVRGVEAIHVEVVAELRMRGGGVSNLCERSLSSSQGSWGFKRIIPCSKRTREAIGGWEPTACRGRLPCNLSRGFSGKEAGAK